MIKQRKNYRIRICGGCKEPFKSMPLQSPYDFCFVHNEKRFTRGEKAPDGKKKVVQVHYHVRRSCLKGTGFKESNVICPNECMLTELHIQKYEEDGVMLRDFINFKS